MNNNPSWRSYWYENREGDMEELEMYVDISPPPTLNVHSMHGNIETFFLIENESDLSSE